jgi:hypothetical protein
MGDERNIFLSTMPATRRDRMPALAVVGVSAVLFACAVPFAGVPLAPVPRLRCEAISPRWPSTT